MRAAKIGTLLLATAMSLVVPLAVHAQFDPPVGTNFDDGTLNGWTVAAATAIVSSPGPSNNAADHFMRGGDKASPPASVLKAPVSFYGNWVNGLALNGTGGGCVEYDYKVFNDGRATQTAFVCPSLTLANSTGTIRASFTCNVGQTVSEAGPGAGWHRYVLPIKVVPPAGPLPSNSFGSWVITTPSGGTGVHWNALLSDVQLATFSADIAGSPAQTEDFGIDNFRVKVCSDFDDATFDGWTKNAATTTISGPGPTGFPTDRYLRGGDQSSPPVSAINAAPVHLGNWTDRLELTTTQGGCVEFDYLVTNDGLASTANVCPSLSLKSNVADNLGLRASFACNASATVTEPGGAKPGWHHFVLPIRLVPGAGPLPSNTFGSWTGVSPAGWNTLMSGVQRVHFNADIAGSPSQTEDFGIDNFCIKSRCDWSQPIPTPLPTAHPPWPISKCVAAKIKAEGKGAAAYYGCYSKGASRGLPTDPSCLAKASAKLTTTFAKLDAKGGCSVVGDGAAREADTAASAAAADLLIGHTAGKCDAAKLKLLGKYLAGNAGCYAKAATSGALDPACLTKNAGKYGKGLDKAEGRGDCTNPGQGEDPQAAADVYLDAQMCAIDPGSPVCPVDPCGNGENDPGEACDPSTDPTTWATCGPDFACSPTCSCSCPTSIVFAGDPNDPASVLDTGWTGLSHRAPIVGNGEVTVQLACPGGGTSRPCGTCTVSGPVANPAAGAGQIDNRRCSNDTSIHCTSNGPCLGGGGTCEFFFGSDLPLAAGGVSTCVVNRFAGGIVGTANLESGEAANSAHLIAQVYTGIAIDQPCAQCVADPAINDGVLGGTCSGGTRNGLACDANGEVPARPDFGSTSLDCPMASGSLIATLPIDLTNATDPVVKTVSASSPSCSGVGATGERCLCDTCNNGNAEPCSADTDCPDPAGPIGPLCGGRRCIGGTNDGAACTLNSECAGGGICNRPGEPTKPSACLDDTNTPGVLDCSDGEPVDGEGECLQGPITTACAVGSGHGQRACATDADCGGEAGSCEASSRPCFLTGGFSGENGTSTLIAAGMEDIPVQDTSHPTLGAVFCVAPTASSAVNTVAGLPGPGRLSIRGLAVGRP